MSPEVIAALGVNFVQLGVLVAIFYRLGGLVSRVRLLEAHVYGADAGTRPGG